MRTPPAADELRRARGSERVTFDHTATNWPLAGKRSS